MEWVYVHTKSHIWNFAGEMDYLLNTVQKVKCINKDRVRICRKSNSRRHWNLKLTDCSKAIPNNPLSRVVYPNYKVTKCGGWLYEV